MSKETDTVTMTRVEYEALIERIEDAEDNAFLDRVEARERGIGKEKARADYFRPNSSVSSSTVNIRSEVGALTAASPARRSPLPPESRRAI